MRSTIAQFVRTLVLALLAVSSHAMAQYAPRSVDDVIALLDQYKPDATRLAAARVLLDKPVPAGSLRQTIIAFHLERANVAEDFGMAERELQERRLALLAGQGTGEEFRLINDLAGRERLYGNYSNVKALLDRQHRLLGTDPPWQLLARLASLSAEFGDIVAAKAQLTKAETAYRAISHSGRAALINPAIFECMRGTVLGAQGLLADAENASRTSIASILKALEGASPANVAGNNLVYNVCESQLVKILAQQGRTAEADYTIRNQIRRNVTNAAGLAPTTVLAVTQLAGVVLQRGQWKDAEALTRAALRVAERQGTGSDSLFALDARRLLANVLLGQSRWPDALNEFEAIQRIAGAGGAQQQYVRGSVEWALALLMNQRAADAQAMMEPLVRDSDAQLGAASYVAGEARGVLGMALYALGERDAALREFRAAVPVLLEGVSEELGGLYSLRARKLAWILESYLSLTLESGAPGAGMDLFQLPDAMRGGGVQRAIGDAAARAASGDAALAALVRKEQDQRHETAFLHEYLSRMFAAPPAQQLPTVIADMRKRIEAISSERRKLQEEIGRRFPAYSNLVRPRPPTVREAQAALRPGEVLLLVHVGEAKTFVWALAQDGRSLVVAAPVGGAEMARKVATLRRALDPGASGAGDVVAAFDVEAAHQVYATLLRPLESVWKGAKHVLVVANGALAQIPFALLPTGPTAVQPDSPLHFAEYRLVPWLIRDVAVTHLPSVGALTTLRSLPAPRAGRLPFAGFGDPVFSKDQQASATGNAMKVRGLPVALRGASRGFELKSSQLAQLPRLPDTAEEIQGVARVLGATGADSVFLDLRANEKEVLTRDLSNRKVIMFATHGLVPGELDGLTQPALALSAPGVAGIAGDGLLTMEEVLGLKLDADWVVLSACNTAAGEGAGAEAISGLGRAFFYAGTRALLVSNWPVETVSAKLITTGVFQKQAIDPVMTRAEALRRTQLDLIDNAAASGPDGKPAYSYAHPLFWAPFSLVGDGG